MAALLPLGAQAQSADSLYVVVNEGYEEDYPLTDVRRIDFTADGLSVVLKSDEAGTTYQFSEVKRICFTSTAPKEPDAINAVRSKAAAMSLFVARDGSYVGVNGWDGKPANVDIYSTAGASVLSQHSWNGGNIDTSALPHGVYIIKVGDKTAKFRK